MRPNQTNWWDPDVNPARERLASNGPMRSPLKNNGLSAAAWASVIGGAGLLAYGLTRRDRAGLVSSVAGTGLIAQATIRARQEEVALAGQIDVHRAVRVMKPVQECYAFWTRAENLPRIMEHVVRVQQLSNNIQRWEISTPLGKTVEFRTEIISNIPNRLISWQTLPDAPIDEWGSVSFTPVSDEETEVTMTMSYQMPGGKIGKVAASLVGRDPEQMARESLRHFKMLIETGEIATTKGQPAGRRGLMGTAMEKILGERARKKMPRHMAEAEQAWKRRIG